jgi:hypothetical protein
MKRICKHKKTGMEGIIISELKGTDDFPNQFGILWTTTYTPKTPNHYYWNDQDKIEIIEDETKI